MNRKHKNVRMVLRYVMRDLYLNRDFY